MPFSISICNTFYWSPLSTVTYHNFTAFLYQPYCLNSSTLLYLEGEKNTHTQIALEAFHLPLSEKSHEQLK